MVKVICSFGRSELQLNAYIIRKAGILSCRSALKPTELKRSVLVLLQINFNLNLRTAPTYT